MNTLIDDAINNSLEFEEKMDKTDFDSWLDGDNSDKLEKLGQDPTPFENFKKDIEALKTICSEMKKKGSKEFFNSKDKDSLEKYIVYKLFESKDLRIEARKCANKEEEKKGYEKSIYHLLQALAVIQNPKIINTDKKWKILLFNDLSICYAGLDNSSLSRGYAEEARKIIEGGKSYKEFEQKFDTGNSTEMLDIANHEFVTARFYDLYTITLFNQALAEKRSHSDNEAERNFKKIINYAEKRENKNTPLRNFNYYSALLNLGDLYIDLSRGEEAIKLLKEIKNELETEKENDIRYWKGYLAMIEALIDKTDYKYAEKMLPKFFEKNTINLIKKHSITSIGFKSVNCYARYKIEKVKNTLRENDNGELKKVQEILLNNLKEIKKRKQKGLELKTYKHLSEVYTLLKEDRQAMEYFIRYFSNGEIYNLSKFIKSEKGGKWINDCEDLDFLESFSEGIYKFLMCDGRRLRKSPSTNLFFNEIIEKIKTECDVRGQLSRAERIVKQIKEILGETKDKKYIEDIFNKSMKNIFPEESPRGKNNLTEKEDKSDLTRKDICKRLDINEKDFDSCLFARYKNKENKHIAEVIVLRRWNSFSPGLYKESTGSLGGGYLLRIKKYLFSFSDITKENEYQGLLNRLRALNYSDLVEIMEGAKFNEEESKIIITKNDKKIATLIIKKELCYLEWQGHEVKIGVVKKEDNNINIYIEDPHVENIVIDPGYNFVQNFRSEGFHVEDIDTIIITHSHMDHCAELLQIMDLLYQFNKRYKDTPYAYNKKKRINLCLSKGAYKHFSIFTSEAWQEQLKDVIILENLEEGMYKPFSGLKISAIETPHWDFGGLNTIGLKIEISIGKNNLCLGFTGDTPWDPKIKKAFQGCNLLCVHLGSLKYQEIGYRDDRYNLKIETREISSKNERCKEFNKKYSKANHLLFFGTLDFIECCADKEEPLVIVGEFGEELKYGLRIDLCKKLRSEANKKRNEKNKIVCLPGDIGLYIGIEEDGKKRVRCNFCEHFVKPDEIDTFSYGREDAIHYICKTCSNTLTDLQKQAFIEHRVTRH